MEYFLLGKDPVTEYKKMNCFGKEAYLRLRATVSVLQHTL